MSWRRMNKTIIWSSSRGLEDVWPRRLFGLHQDVKTSSEDEDEKRLQDVFKTSSSRRMFSGLFGSGYLLINVIFLCWKKRQATFNNTEYLSKSNIWNNINDLISMAISLSPSWLASAVMHLLSRRYQVHKSCFQVCLQFSFVVLAIQGQRGTVFII